MLHRGCLHTRALLETGEKATLMAYFLLLQGLAFERWHLLHFGLVHLHNESTRDATQVTR
jgi:hypothetical protein